MLMRAAMIHEHGPPGVLRLEEVERPEPGTGEVRVRVAAAALNHLDVWVRRGLPIDIPLPHIGGSDIAGVVDACGAHVDGWAAGTPVVVDPSVSCGACPWCHIGEQPLCRSFRIIGEHLPGGFAEYVVVPAANLYELPAAYPLERAAAAPLAFLTAWRGLITRARLQRGQSVLITGASGGVATAAVQIARMVGAQVHAVTTAEHVERVRALGAAFVYDRDAVDFSREVWRETDKQGVDVVFDSVGAATFPQCVRSLGRGGRFVVYGGTSGPQVELDVRPLFWKQLDILGTTMSNHQEFEAAMDAVVAGRLEPVIDVVWPLDRIGEAHDRLERGEQFGKIVLVP
jgi:NADPH:quinone reductase-like Zn-dependent oxidoreductase